MRKKTYFSAQHLVSGSCRWHNGMWVSQNCRCVPISADGGLFRCVTDRTNLYGDLLVSKEIKPESKISHHSHPEALGSSPSPRGKATYMPTENSMNRLLLSFFGDIKSFLLGYLLAGSWLGNLCNKSRLNVADIALTREASASFSRLMKVIVFT